MSGQVYYPIKFAVLELKEKGGWTEGYKDINKGFIASKCYVMESDIIYDADGSCRLVHKVVFPFDNYSLFKQSLSGQIRDIGVGTIPSYDMYNNPYPITIVEDLYDTYEDAKAAAISKNEEFKENLGTQVSTNDIGWEFKLQLLQNNFDSEIRINDLFEEQIAERTRSMSVTSEPKDVQIKALRPLKNRKTI